MSTLTLPMAVVLCNLDDETGQPLTDPELFDRVLAAAMLAELDHLGRVRHHDGRIASRPAAPIRSLELAACHLSARPQTVKEVIEQIAEEDLQHAVQSQLVGLGALKAESRKRWWFRREWSWPTKDLSAETELREHLRAYVDAPADELHRMDILLALLEAADLLGTIWDTPPVDVIETLARRWPWRGQLRAARPSSVRLNLE